MPLPPPLSAFCRFETIDGEEIWLRRSAIISCRESRAGPAFGESIPCCVLSDLGGMFHRVRGSSVDIGKIMLGERE